MLNAAEAPPAALKRPEWDQGYVKCKCPVLVIGTLNGRRIRLSTTKFLPPDKARDMEAGRNLAVLWERNGVPTRPEEYAPTKPAAPEPKEPPRTNRYIRDRRVPCRCKRPRQFRSHALQEEDHIREATGSILRNQGNPLPQRTGREHRPRMAQQRGRTRLSLAARNRGECSASSGSVNVRAGPANYADQMTRGLGKIKHKPTQTGYFPPDEYAAIVDATHIYCDRPRVDKHSSLIIGGDRIRALTELMRWTGFRIRDAATLEKRRMELDQHTGQWRVLVYAKKNGEPVYCPIPPHVAEMLLNVPASQKGNTNDRYFFWTGSGISKTVVANWQRSYRKLFELAAIKRRTVRRSGVTRTCLGTPSQSRPCFQVCGLKRYRLS